MNRRVSLFACFTAAASAAGLKSASAALEKKHRVAFDLAAAETERWNAALNNVENVRKAFEAGSTEAHLIVHGKAYPLVQKTNSAMEERLKSLVEAGVRIDLCENTMKRFNIDKATLFPFIGTVDSAVAELVRLQEAGWSYIKAGV